MPNKGKPRRLARVVALLAADVDDGFDAIREDELGEAWIYRRGRPLALSQPPLASKGSSSRKTSSSSRSRVFSL